MSAKQVHLIDPYANNGRMRFMSVTNVFIRPRTAEQHVDRLNELNNGATGETLRDINAVASRWQKAIDARDVEAIDGK